MPKKSEALDELISLRGYGNPAILRLTNGVGRDPETNRRIVGVWKSSELKMYREYVDHKGEFWYSHSTHISYQDIVAAFDSHKDEATLLEGTYRFAEVTPMPLPLANFLEGSSGAAGAIGTLSDAMQNLGAQVAQALNQTKQLAMTEQAAHQMAEQLARTRCLPKNKAKVTVKRTIEVVEIKDRRKLALDKDI